MARPRSEDRRNAILSAAARVIASQGLAAAATAVIAKEAGVSNGSVFVYFDTKAALLNDLYLALKEEMMAAAVAGLDTGGGEPREQVCRMWTQWLRWATTSPHKRRALAQLEVADDITASSRQTAHAAFSDIADLVNRSRADGPMREVPLSFVLTLTTSIAEATIDTLLREPGQAEEYSSAGFDAVWRVIAGSPLPIVT
jgi:AcrR family transcriptional regulator